jgi:hypothetical protein
MLRETESREAYGVKREAIVGENRLGTAFAWWEGDAIVAV